MQTGTLLAKKGADSKGAVEFYRPAGQPPWAPVLGDRIDHKERQMRQRYYEDQWDRRFEHVVRNRTGFAWGTFFASLIIGAILF